MQEAQIAFPGEEEESSDKEDFLAQISKDSHKGRGVLHQPEAHFLF